ncbi:MAG: dicarboxylate/amino acid:cation symporter [Fuerstiella sp.]
MSEPFSVRERLPLHLQILIAMILGTVIGVAVNPGDIDIAGDVSVSVVRDGEAILLTETSAAGDETQSLFTESFASEKAFADSFPELAQFWKNDPTARIPVTKTRARLAYSMGGVSVTWQRAHNGVPAVSVLTAKSTEQLPPFWQSLAEQNPPGVAGSVVTLAKTIGDLFLRLLKMVTVPLILTSLVTGVTGLGTGGNFGRMFRRTIMYYVSTSMLAILTGLVLVNVVNPGSGAVLPGGGKALEPADQSLVEVLYEQLNRLIPTNPFAAIAEGEFLSIISFAILLGIFINFVGGESGQKLKNFFQAAFDVMMRMTAWVISLAPLGVAAFMVYATATQGLSVFQTLAWYMLTVFLALLVHACVVLPLIVVIVGRRSAVEFARQMSPALLTAFSTASSNATLPLTMSCVENRAGVPNETSSFVLPLGATINMDGTALYEVVAVLFIAQATPGFDLSLAQQITVAFTALIASVGAAGIPHAGLVMMAIVLQAVGLPLEAQGIIIAVDRILDMCRTSVNVWSDSCGCVVVSTLDAAAEQSLAREDAAV